MPDIGVEAERAAYDAWADGLRAQGENAADYPVMGMFGAVVTDDPGRDGALSSAQGRWRRELYASWFTEAMDVPFDAEKLAKPTADVRALSGAMGDPETVIAGIERYIGRGIPYTHVATGGLHAELDKRGRNEAMEAFARHVMPYFRGDAGG
jgi:alkanesulfonate monooxygenase SsuD/methylene tetrahydromethanopterin reductase-like flavin-dependent oxidoreductase (luciferase family)